MSKDKDMSINSLQNAAKAPVIANIPKNKKADYLDEETKKMKVLLRKISFRRNTVSSHGNCFD